MPSAPPFTPAALTFLRQLRRNNNREWFQPRKGQFDELLRRPMLGVCGQVSDALRSFAVDHVTAPEKAAKRIYRDVRFSKDKTPYKTGVSAIFPRAGLGADGGAVFYFGVSPDGVQVAAGLYNPGPAELAAVRDDIAGDPAGFTKLVTAKPLTKRLGPCRGEQLVKVPKAYPSDHPAAGLLRQKQWYFAEKLDAEVATHAALVRTLIESFRAAAPVVARLNRTILTAIHPAEDARGPARPKPMF